MSTSARGVVSDGCGGTSVRELQVGAPRAGEALVRLHASGVCHTDHDLIGLPEPFMLGHEGAGVIEALGDGSSGHPDGLAVGQRVMLNWAISCGRCFQCVEGDRHLCERHSPLMSRGVVTPIAAARCSTEHR